MKHWLDIEVNIFLVVIPFHAAEELIDVKTNDMCLIE